MAKLSRARLSYLGRSPQSPSDTMIDAIGVLKAFTRTWKSTLQKLKLFPQR